VHRPIQRNRGLPLVAKLGLVAAVALLGVTVLYLGAGGLGRVVGGISASLGGFITNITAAPTPKPSVAAISDPPSLQQPAEPYTAEPTVDLVVTVPSAVAGDLNSRIRVYLALKDQAPTPIQEAPLAATPQTVIPVELTKGINDFSVTIVGPGGESDPSPMVRFVLDQAPAKITIYSPDEGSVVNGATVEINGKTQARATLLAHNAANGSSVSGNAATDGLFTLSLPISTGSNEITITGTDPAGNVKELLLTVRRGSGTLTAVLGSSAYRLSVADLPRDLTLTAAASDPDGNPVVGADITFTLSIPGIPTVTADLVTDDHGRAEFTTAVPVGADPGQGSATILLSSEEFGSTQDYTVITLEP
jgi:glucodextranase-like protein